MDTEHWASYYRSGALVSCPTNPEPYYTMELRDAWGRFFAELDDGDRILDLGTGNGPVALIAKETAEEYARTFAIDGVDLADIDPHLHVPNGQNMLSGISFHGGVNTEALPFDDQQFEAVTGQYIVEYTDTGKTLGECARVIAPGGRCQFILHHMDSVIVRNALESIRQAELIDETEAIGRFRAYCEPAHKPATRNAIYAAGEVLQAEAKASSNPLLLRYVIDAISGMLASRSRLTEEELIERTNTLEHELAQWVLRLKDLADAARSAEEMAALVMRAEGAGFVVVDLDEQMQADKLIGWRLSMNGPL